MRGIDELDHYELLEIGRGASQTQIDRAYRVAQLTYAEGSLALYSVFDSRDAEAIRARVDEAYRVLSDPELREKYDAETPESPASTRSAASGPVGQTRVEPAQIGFFADPAMNAAARAGSHARPAEGADYPGAAGAANGVQAEDGRARPISQTVASVDEAVEEYDALEDDGRGEFDGVRLRRNRLFRGYELDDISDVTKVSSAHLRNIEEENFGDLPADVYVRGFVTAYAQTIGLDPRIVVPSYMERVQECRQGSQRAGFLGRR